MSKLGAVLAMTALLAVATAAQAEDRGISKRGLAAMGLPGLKVMSDVDGSKIRGTAATAFSLSSTSASSSSSSASNTSGAAAAGNVFAAAASGSLSVAQGSSSLRFGLAAGFGIAVGF